MKVAIELLASFFGCMGFCMVFRLKRKYILTASFIGLIYQIIYIIVNSITGDVFIPSVVSAFVVAAFSEIAARIYRAPAVLFLVPGVLPGVPGGNLYKAMLYLVYKDVYMAGLYGKLSLQYGFAIAIGISLVWALRGLKKWFQ